MPDDFSWSRRRSMTDLPLPDVSGLSDPRLELSLLGTLLAAPRLLEELPPRFSGDHLTDPHHRTLFSAMIDFGAGEVSATAIQVALRGSIPDDLVSRAIAAMIVPDRNAVRQYADDVSNLHDRRQLLAIADRMRAEALVGEAVAPVARIRTQAQIDLDTLGSGMTAAPRAWVSIGQAADGALSDADRAAQRGHIVGVSCGMPSVDEALGGLEPRTVTILGGRPGMGKSALAAAWARAIGQQKVGPVANFSLEMSGKANARRALADLSGVEASAIRRGRHGDYARDLLKARNELNDLPIYFHDVRSQTVSEMRSMARQLERQHGKLAAIFVDHLHIVEAEKADQRRDETARVTAVSAGMHSLAAEFDCPLVALCQLSRDVERRDDKRPTLADLRQSGAIEQNADFVMFLYREEYYLRLEGPPKPRSNQMPAQHQRAVDDYEARLQEVAGQAELILAKAREEANGLAIRLRFDAHLTSFRDPRML